MKEAPELYWVANIQPVTGKAARLRATFDLAIRGLGIVKRCRFLRHPDGTPFIYGPALQDAYLGWVTTFEFDSEVADRVAKLVARTIDSDY